MQIISKFLIVNKNVIFGIMINYLYSRLMTSQTFFMKLKALSFAFPSQWHGWLHGKFWKFMKTSKNKQCLVLLRVTEYVKRHFDKKMKINWLALVFRKNLPKPCMCDQLLFESCQLYIFAKEVVISFRKNKLNLLYLVLQH